MARVFSLACALIDFRSCKLFGSAHLYTFLYEFNFPVLGNKDSSSIIKEHKYCEVLLDEVFLDNEILTYILLYPG